MMINRKNSLVTILFAFIAINIEYGVNLFAIGEIIPDTEAAYASIMSLNIRTSAALDSCPCGCWDLRKFRVSKSIRDILPDFIGTQETTEKQKKDLDGLLGDLFYRSFGESSGAYSSNSAEINAIWYRSDKWDLLQSGTFWLSDSPAVMSNSWGMNFYRTVVFGRFIHTTTQKTACLFNTHFSLPGNNDAQVKSANLVQKKMKEICQETDSLVVLLGDLNAEPTYEAVKFLTDSNSSFPLVSTTSGGTWCGSFYESKCISKFDYILNHPKSNSCVVESNVLRTSVDNCYISDHAVPFTTFCVNGNCCLPSPIGQDPIYSATLGNGASKQKEDSKNSTIFKKEDRHENINDIPGYTHNVGKVENVNRDWFGVSVILGCTLVIILTIIFGSRIYRKKSLRSQIKTHMRMNSSSSSDSACGNGYINPTNEKPSCRI